MSACAGTRRMADLRSKIATLSAGDARYTRWLAFITLLPPLSPDRIWQTKSWLLTTLDQPHEHRTHRRFAEMNDLVKVKTR